MTRDNAKAVEQGRMLTQDELDAVSGGRKAGGTQIQIDSMKLAVSDSGPTGGGGAGKIIGILVG
jgi:hypothetical protein